MIKRIAFTMYSVADMARARKFYEEDLGLVKTSNYPGDKWIEYDLAGGCFAITSMVPVKPSADAGGSIAFEVDNLDELLATLKSKGVPVKMDNMDTPVCNMAVVVDPEGNAVTLHQLKRKT